MIGNPRNDRGSSLFELMVVVALLFVTMGAIFELFGLALQRSSAEQSKIDMVQQAREFMDQISQDLRQTGYPNIRTYVSSGILTASPVANDVRLAVGLVKVDSGELWIEGDVDGTGTVSVVRYYLDTSTENGCPCLKRSQLPKIQGDPLSGQTTPEYQLEVQNVRNSEVFSAFTWGSTGVPVTLPVDFTNSGSSIATIDTIKVVLTLETAVPDSRTRQKPINTLISTVKLHNCSQAATGLTMSCQ